MLCNRCWKQNPADVHTCTPCREYMLDIIQKEISDWRELMFWDLIEYIWSSNLSYILYLDKWQAHYRLIEIFKIRDWKNKPLSQIVNSHIAIQYIRSLLPQEIRK